MMLRCFGCDAEHDTDVMVVSPTAVEDGLNDQPIEPFFVLDIQDGPEYRQTRVCHACFHQLEPDMWISRVCWEAINPTIPYARLPLYAEGTPHDATSLQTLP